MSVEHWENYFRGGQLATCPTGPDGGYDLELADAWRAFFEPLPARAVIVDVATGNGAVLALAAEQSRQLGRHWSMHGCDLARIDPVRDVPGGTERFAGVQFHPGVATESLPFEHASADAVSGQYALEYSDPGAALAEVARVLKPGGRAQFVLHHSESKLMLNALGSLDECEKVLVSWDVFGRLRTVLAAGADDAIRQRMAVDDLQGLVRQLKEEAADGHQLGGRLIVRATLAAVHQLLQMRVRWPAAMVVPEIARAEGDVRASQRRLRDLLARGLDADALAALVKSAEVRGLACLSQGSQFHAESNLVGWRVVFTRN